MKDDIEFNHENKIKEQFIIRNINHPILNHVYTDLMEKIETSKEGKVFIVFGPTGVGKSTLYAKVKSQLLFLSNDNMKVDRGMIPVVSLELPSPDNGKFNWKDFYQRILIEFNEPLIGNKVDQSNSYRGKISNYKPTTSPELRKSLENAIRYRKTKVILLDEAQHLLKMGSGRRIQDQMDFIKSMANITGSIFVLFGTYELNAFFDMNGQLSRRISEIHFPRYDIKIEKDLMAFKGIVYTFQSLLPFEEKEGCLLNHWEFFYERSVGCVGILKEWIDKCFLEAIKESGNGINLDIIEKYAPAPSKAYKIAEEAINGENEFKDNEGKIEVLQNLLGMSQKEGHKYNVGLNENDKGEKTKKITVGKRNPKRDKIGIDESN
ncbi:AAA family ATPase [Metabacillus sp. KIGAM252]|uniref:AAA family ATPase n=1 Tax=Metabacillus flavus TaxID=2823519 RepID=A0ABS5LIG3_9BACI|nr:ATP-binding protein [Metabacillus flavus]MBS2970530.1 AAA family ATPase [Metabacillus flavus]